MKVVTKKISELHMAEKNVRKHPQKQLDEMKRSFSMFGQYRPLIVSSDGEVLVGNGLFEAMAQDGKETVECIVLPEDTTENQKKKLMMSDNKIFELGADAVANIDEILSSLDGDFDIPGFDERVLTQLYEEVEEEVKSISTTSVSVLGVIPESKIESIKKAEESRKKNPPADDASKYEVKEDVVKEQEEHEGESYITCPHCGVKIYGYN